MKHLLLTALFVLIHLVYSKAQNSPMSVSGFGIPGCGCDGCINLTVVDGVPPYTYQWSNGMVNTNTNSNYMYCGFCPGQYSVTVASGLTGVTASTTVFVEQVPF